MRWRRAPEYRFDYPAYRHQVEAWEHLRAPDPRSVLVSSGTGSGKTECFLVPLLDDLAREAEREGRLAGVRALMLYPLNALIASQQERLTRWTAPFGGDIRFALFNGLMTDRREGDRARDEAKCPEQVLYRRTLRADPPPILVTNNTMLENMTIRREDHPIIEASQGRLRWIMIDEAHSHVGSAAAEVSLLLRRVLQTFGVRATDVRFVATSATIGGTDERARDDLVRYMADLAGVDPAQVRVVFGERRDVDLPPIDGSGSFAANATVQALVRGIEKAPLSLAEVGARTLDLGMEPAAVLEAMADAGPTGKPLLPLRIHQFIRAVPGLWSCLDPACGGAKPADWPFGGIAWERDEACRTCSAPLLEIVSCRQCGEPWLDAFDHGDRLTGRATPPDRDEFAAASARETDADEGEDEDAPAAPPARADRQRRLLGMRAIDGLRQREVDPPTGTFPDERGRGSPVWISRAADDGCCPRCHAAPSPSGGKPLWPFRFGAPFLIQNATPTMLEGVSPHSERPSAELPAGGRQLLSFTDSRQGTARLAANVETMAERGFVRAFVYHMVQKAGTPCMLAPEEREALEKRRAAFATLAAADKAFAADLARVEAELNGTGPPAAVPWTDAVRALAVEPMMKEGIGKVWDADRDQRFEDQPEAIANYRQRVGRAGRRGQSFAASLTFARDTPLDREAFRDPVRYFRRGLRAPRVTLDSRRIVQRHVNALLLARWFREAKGELTRIKAGAFYGYPLSLAEAPEADPPVARLVAWLRDPSTATGTASALEALTRGTALAGDGGSAGAAADAFDQAAAAFGREWRALREQADAVAAEARAGIERQLRRMGKEALLGELADRSVLPGHGFPTAVVPFVTECWETRNRRVRDDEGGETARNRRYDYPSRNADVALREYAPGAQVVVDGLVWTSAGVQLNWQRPTEAEGGDRVQSIRWAWTCTECGEAGCEALMPEACSACGTAALERTQFLEPAGFRVEWRSKPHADTNTVDYIEPRPARISAREARWEPMLDPALGRARATADGLVFHHSMGGRKQGYRICLDCGRAEEESDTALADHDALMPPKGGTGRCAGNDRIWSKTRPLALGHEVLTDVAELQPAALDDPGTSWALASALREALARRLGIDPRELGLGVARRTGAMGEATHSLFLYDRSAGGAGYAPRLLADLAGVLKDAGAVLACSADCMRGCSACVLVADLFQQQEIIDRRAALAFVTRLLADMAEPQPEDIAGPDCRLSPPVPDAIARRVGRGDVVALWMGEEMNISAFADPPLATLLGTINRAGAEARMVLPERLIAALDDSARAGLRNAAHRHGFTLWSGEAPPGANGAGLVATLARAGGVAFLSRDPDAARIGPGWGSGAEHPIVEMPLAAPAMTRVPDWRAASNDRHDFRAGPETQSRAMLDSAAFVSGQGESYVAVTRF